MTRKNLDKIRKDWPELLKKLTVEVDREYGCFKGSVFKQNLFAEYLIRNQIEWPRTVTGKLDLADSTHSGEGYSVSRAGEPERTEIDPVTDPKPQADQ